MKYAIFLLLFISKDLLAQYSQVIYVSPISNEIQNNGGVYEYEDKNVIVRYCFWARNGIMGLEIYNKSGKPIYIDWKKSCMIYNSRKFPYYVNKTTGNYLSFGSTYGYGWVNFFYNSTNAVYTSSSVQYASETIVKSERITFIPPRSYIRNAFYNILQSIDVFHFNQKERKLTLQQINDYDVFVSVPRNQIKFRNFLSYSETEDFVSEKYIDNEFFVKKIITLSINDFDIRDVNGKYRNDWKKANRFYITGLRKRDVFD